MKHYFIFFVFLSATALFAQNNEMKARIAFEDAETAFESGNYQEALNQLEEAGNALGKPSLKIEFLHILTLDKLVQQENYSYKHLADLRRIAKSYLDKSTDPDKYREVNNIVKRIAGYPKSQTELNATRESRAAKEIEINEKFAKFQLLDFYISGESLKETKARMKLKNRFIHTLPNGYTHVEAAWNWKSPVGTEDMYMQVLFDYYENKAVHYECVDYASYGIRSKDVFIAHTTKEKEYWTEYFGFNPKEILKDKTTKYVWNRGEKVFTVEISLYNDAASISYNGYDSIKTYYDFSKEMP